MRPRPARAPASVGSVAVGRIAREGRWRAVPPDAGGRRRARSTRVSPSAAAVVEPGALEKRRNLAESRLDVPRPTPDFGFGPVPGNALVRRRVRAETLGVRGDVCARVRGGADASARDALRRPGRRVPDGAMRQHAVRKKTSGGVSALALDVLNDGESLSFSGVRETRGGGQRYLSADSPRRTRCRHCVRGQRRAAPRSTRWSYSAWRGLGPRDVASPPQPRVSCGLCPPR